jgi:hypothetical protein
MYEGVKIILCFFVGYVVGALIAEITLRIREKNNKIVRRKNEQSP